MGVPVQTEDETDEAFILRKMAFEEDQNKIKKENRDLFKKGILKCDNPWISKWNFLIIFFAIYNCIMLPVDLAFDFSKINNKHINRLKFINYCVDVAFFLDIIISFRTTFRHAETNIEITDPAAIKKNYLMGMFWIDLVSTIPFDLLIYYMD